MNTITYIVLAVLGLCVGSFCNVLIFRLPKGEEFVKTPSHCMSCGHKLSWYENIPLVRIFAFFDYFSFPPFLPVFYRPTRSQQRGKRQTPS